MPTVTCTRHSPPVRSPARTRRAFTLVELLVVIAIITILATMITIAVTMALTHSKVAETDLKIKTLGTAIEEYQRKCGSYPPCDSDDALESSKQLYKGLTNPPKGVRYEFPADNFRCEDVDSSSEKAIVDSFGHAIWYRTAKQYEFHAPNKTSFRLVSAGIDGSFEDSDEDNIFNWEYDAKEDSPNHLKRAR